MGDATTATAVSGGSLPGTRLAVLHRTTFHYGSPVTRSANTLRLEPRVFPYQKTISAIVRVIPATRLRRFSDLFQNINHHFELQDPHDRLVVESRIRVHNLPLIIAPYALQSTGREEPTDPDVIERTWPFLGESNRVSKDPRIWKQAVDVTHRIDPVFEKARAVMSWIHRNFEYVPGVTGVKAHVQESFAMRRGVCQDFTHIMSAMCRSLGIPARYASGYLYNGPKDSLVGAQASHAWCEVYLPTAGWIGFDPTNNNLADERYVKVAVGRDYDDVAPIEGSYHGSANSRMEVCVEVEKI